jgi:hypothetical protein
MTIAFIDEEKCFIFGWMEIYVDKYGAKNSLKIGFKITGIYQ